MPRRLDRSLDPSSPPPERSFWELLPRRNFRRVLFLVIVLLAVLALRKTGGGAFRGLLDAVAPPPAPAGAAGPAGFQRLQVRPPAPPARSAPP